MTLAQDATTLTVSVLGGLRDDPRPFFFLNDRATEEGTIRATLVPAPSTTAPTRWVDPSSPQLESGGRVEIGTITLP